MIETYEEAALEAVASLCLFRARHVRRPEPDPQSTYWEPEGDLGSFVASAMRGIVHRTEMRQCSPEDAILVWPPYCTESSVETDIVARSNIAAIDDSFGDSAVHLSGWGYCEDAVALWAVGSHESTEEVERTLSALANYPLLSESAHSELEQEEIESQWDDGGRDHVISTLNAEHLEDGCELDPDLADEAFDSVYFEACRESGEYPTLEGGELQLPIPASLAELVEPFVVEKSDAT